MLGGKQIALIDRGFNQVADVGIYVQCMDLRSTAGQHIAHSLGGRMMPIACRNG